MGLLIKDKDYDLIELEESYKENKKSIIKMFEIQEKIFNSNNNIQIDATKCEHIGATCLAILSSVVLIARDKDIKIKFTKKSKLLNTLLENGFINIKHRTIGENNIIPLNKIENETDASVIIHKLIESSQLKKLEKDKKDTLYSRIYEIPNNALTHSNSEYGIVCHGYFNNKKTFTFSIYDLGIGIPQSVRRYKEDESLSSKDALRWALEKGNSTKISDYPRGIGFTMLEEFRKEFKGKITIITEDIMYTTKDDGNTNYSNLKKKIVGTLYTLKISV